MIDYSIFYLLATAVPQFPDPTIVTCDYFIYVYRDDDVDGIILLFIYMLYF